MLSRSADFSDQGYAILSVEKFDEDRRTFSGLATSPSLDRDGDVIEPLGISVKGPVPLLMHHDRERPVGTVTFHPPTAEGMRFDAQIPKVSEEGVVKARVDEAWHSVRHRLLTAVSVRINAKREDVKKLASGGMHWLRSHVTELSLVTIGSNPDALIHTIRSLDHGRPAASGTRDDEIDHTPRVRGTVRVVAAATRQDAAMTTQDRIKSYENKRAATVARMAEIMKASDDKGETLDSTQAEEYDGLEVEVKTLDEHLTRARRHEELNKTAAVAVNGESQEKAAASRGGQAVIRVVDQTPPGIRFARYAMCVAKGKSSRMDAYEIAKANYPDEHGIHEAIKTAVTAGTTSNTFAPLLQYTDWMGDFVDYLRPATILGKFGQNGVPSLRRAPFNTRVMTQTAGGTAYWVGQGKGKPVTKGTYGTLTLDFHKLACIAVLTEEEVKFVPSSEAKVRDDLRDAIAAEMDQAFIDPANAGVANVKPASITNGVAATAVSGTTAVAFMVDFKNLMANFISANVDLDSPVLIMSKQIALNLSLMMNALGQREFPDISMTGGSFYGVPVITSQYLSSLGSPATGMIVLVNASDIYLADDGAVSVSASGEASIEMDDAPTQDGVAGTGASLVSLWQANLLGLRAERFVTWKKRRATAVQYLSPVAYVPQ